MRQIETPGGLDFGLRIICWTALIYHTKTDQFPHRTKSTDDQGPDLQTILRQSYDNAKVAIDKHLIY